MKTHSTFAAALAEYRRRQRRITVVIDAATATPVQQVQEKPIAYGDYGGGQRGRVEIPGPPTTNELLRAALGGDRASAIARWRSGR